MAGKGLVVSEQYVRYEVRIAIVILAPILDAFSYRDTGGRAFDPLPLEARQHQQSAVASPSLHGAILKDPFHTGLFERTGNFVENVG